MPGVRPAAPEELPPGVPAGTRCTLPVVDTGEYLPWLAAACAAAGVTTVPGRVDALDDVPGEVVVVAAGSRPGRCSVTAPACPCRARWCAWPIRG
ncbi:hypothetical protein JD79_04122 [Geodermatophilus normandii]|uniref:Uncharacterized protein n=1 Tax=Geodermatophilus normandii TaxID=1137989 RepID=A0A317QP97_9ACTN|nr:hypothetical protein [Geodermatophilus normandii]PWW24929.1 hypothetical protein JD79_04122 [Geodermatophilus normandii]